MFFKLILMKGTKHHGVRSLTAGGELDSMPSLVFAPEVEGRRNVKHAVAYHGAIQRMEDPLTNLALFLG